MTLLGSMTCGNGRNALVDQWGASLHQTIAVVPAAKFSNSSRRYALWVTGTVGPFLSWTTGGVSSVRLALQAKDPTTGALLGGFNVRDTIEWRLHDPSIRDAGYGVPFQMLVILDPISAGGYGAGGTHPNWPTGWPVGAELHVVGWLQHTAGPQDGVAVVSDVSVIVWDLEAIDSAGPYAAYESRIQPAPRLNQLGTIAYRDLDLATGSGQKGLLGIVGSGWLCFWSTTYQPYEAPGPWLELRMRRVGPGTETTIDRLGMSGTAYSTLGPGVNFGVLHAHGGIGAYTQQTLSDTMKIYGQDNFIAGVGNSAGGQTIVHGVSCLAIPITALHGWAHDWNPTPPPTHFGPLPGAWLPWSFIVDRTTDYVVLHQGRAAPASGARVRQAFVARLERGDRTPIGGPCGRVSGGHIVLSSTDRVPAYVGYPIQMLTGYDVGVRHAFEVLTVSDSHLGEFCSSVGFGFETNPGNGDTPAVEVGEIVAIIPGYESIDAASLPALPAELAATYETSIDAPMADFTSTTGYRWRLPQFVSLRRVVSGQVTALDAAERDALLEFLAANRTFAWTPKHEEQAVAWLQIDRAVATQTSETRWSVVLRIAELVFTGP